MLLSGISSHPLEISGIPTPWENVALPDTTRALPEDDADADPPLGPHDAFNRGLNSKAIRQLGKETSLPPSMDGEPVAPDACNLRESLIRD